MTHRVLAVDDNEIVGCMLAARLWVAGYDVEVAHGAAEAFLALKRGAYDLVLMDLEMPEVDGLQALDILMRDQLCPGVPVVLLTASENFDVVQRAYGLGAKGYLTKSTDASELVKTVGRIVRTRNLVWIDDHHCVLEKEADAAGGPTFMSIASKADAEPPSEQAERLDKPPAGLVA